MNRMKKCTSALYLSLLLVLTMLLAACGGDASSARPSSSAPASESVSLPGYASGQTILFSLAHLNNDVVVDVARGVQDRCNEFGIEIILHNSHNDAAEQLSVLQSNLEYGLHAIICQPIDAAALSDVFAAAKEQGVPVISYGAELAEADASVTFSATESGSMLVQHAVMPWVAQTLDGEAVVAILEYAGSDGYADGMEEALMASGLEIEVVRHTVESASDGTQAMLTLLETYPDLRVVLGEDDAVALAAGAALEELATQDEDLQEELSQFFFGGIGCSATGVAAIRSDNLFKATVNLQSYQTGVQLVDDALKAMDGNLIASVNITPTVVDGTNAAQYA